LSSLRGKYVVLDFGVVGAVGVSRQYLTSKNIMRNIKANLKLSE
jgi:hypothetical protein